ncbi:MAG: flagellar basal body P-ring formation chaperone FlgA [bacterium]|jgi:flagella basal body P-ring formation protein FlgA|nr:flagellar basal body P-ring formation chaperone FlgA [bacterium]
MNLSITITAVLLTVFAVPMGLGEPLQPTQPEKTVIVLAEKYVVPSEKNRAVCLGDISEKIHSTDPAIQQALSNLPLLSVPQPGEERAISRPAIYQALRAAQIPYYSIQIEGALQTRILGPGRTYTIQEIIADIQQQILVETGWSEEELVLRVLTPPSDTIWLPLEGVEKEVSRVNPYVLGNSRYEILFYQDQVLVKKIPVMLSVQRRRVVYAVTDSLKRGDVIRESQVREMVQLINNTMYDNQLVDQKEELIGRQCRVPLSKGAVVKWSNLENHYLTKWGEPVQMIVRNNGMLIQTLAIAQQKGAKGDVIPVKTQATGKIVKARIVSKGLVELITS